MASDDRLAALKAGELVFKGYSYGMDNVSADAALRLSERLKPIVENAKSTLSEMGKNVFLELSYDK